MQRIAKDILQDTHLAEDAVQEAFLRVIKKMGMVGEVKSTKTRNLLIIMVKNVALTEYIRRTKVESYQDPETMERYATQETEESIGFELHWQESLRNLPPSYQEILLLLAEGYSQREIAIILDENYETIRKRTQRARSALKDIL